MEHETTFPSSWIIQFAVSSFWQFRRTLENLWIQFHHPLSLVLDCEKWAKYPTNESEEASQRENSINVNSIESNKQAETGPSYPMKLTVNYIFDCPPHSYISTDNCSALEEDCLSPTLVECGVVVMCCSLSSPTSLFVGFVVCCRRFSQKNVVAPAIYLIFRKASAD